MTKPFVKGLQRAEGLATAFRHQQAAVWLFAPFHAIHDAWQTAFYKLGRSNYKDEKDELDQQYQDAKAAVLAVLGPALKPMTDAVYDAMTQGVNERARFSDRVKAVLVEDLQEYLLGRVPVGRPNNLTDYLDLYGRDENEGRVKTWNTAEKVEAITSVFDVQSRLAQALPALPRLPAKTETPHASWLHYGIGATAVTSIPQGAATYAVVFGFGLLCSTYIGGLAGTITHGVTAGIVGAWFSGGRAFSGLASGMMIGVGAFALQTYGVQLLAGLLPSLSEAHLHLVASVATILGTFILESIAQVITRKTGEHELFGKDYLKKVSYKSEYPLFYKAGKIWDSWAESCRGA